MLQHLPQESWTQTILRDEQLEGPINPASERPADPEKFGPWALVNYQIAQLTDATNRLYYVAATGKRINPDSMPPEPTPRPGLRRGASEQISSELAKAKVLYLDRLRARG